MDVDEQDQAADVSPETPAVVDPEAPFGRRDDGTPYKRDPSFFQHLRKGNGRTSSRRTAAGPAGVKPAPAVKPAPSRRATKPEYARRIVELGKVGLAFVGDPVDRKIVESQLPGFAVALEKAALHYEWLGQILDKALLAGGGLGPMTDVLITGGTAAGLIALNHGNRHPMLVALLGAQLQALQLQALTEAQQQDAQAAQLAAMLQQPEPAEYTA